jgi:hypothetical protein
MQHLAVVIAKLDSQCAVRAALQMEKTTGALSVHGSRV